jgi:toxin ParE1/3/4
MKQFLLTNAAKKDLKAIVKYTEKKWGRQQRNIYLKQFDDTFGLLASNPKIGFECDYLKPGI